MYADEFVYRNMNRDEWITYRLATAGARSIEHGTYLSTETLELMKERGTWLVPTWRERHAPWPKHRRPSLPVSQTLPPWTLSRVASGRPNSTHSIGAWDVATIQLLKKME